MPKKSSNSSRTSTTDKQKHDRSSDKSRNKSTNTQSTSTSNGQIKRKTPIERIALLGSKTPKELGRDPHQSILDMLRVALQDTFGATDFDARLQQIKAYFYMRDYNAVFSEPAHLPVYAARYVPGRALCYYHMFTQHPALLALLAGNTRIYALGAGAGSELAAMMAAIVHVKHVDQKGRPISTESTEATKQPSVSNEENNEKEKESIETVPQVTLHMQDIADWRQVIQQIESTARNKWSIPVDRFKCEFSQGNVLNLVGHASNEEDKPSNTTDMEHPKQTDAETEADKAAICAEFERADLVTAMFVMNELFTDKQQAMKLVQSLVTRLRSGAHFLLVDSAGSFSNLKVGQRTYMIYTIFDALHAYFEPIISEDSEWYRYPKQSNYPLELNNMRYFIRLYRRL
ncbi:hypothetical protein BDF22DRAFT_680083 [Syncephalis plumigaleata]|nr:hypothetical protein BDF22DRAFT_680083 [Syncephalis plumigaleata]